LIHFYKRVFKAKGMIAQKLLHTDENPL